MIEETLLSIPIKRPKVKLYHRQHLCLDKGYDSVTVRELIESFHYIGHVKSRGDEAKELKDNPSKNAKRWIVERTHSWLNRFRKILIRWEKKSKNHLALIHLAFALIIYKKLERF